MPPRDDATGLVLAGGRSSRLGRSKALEPFLGEPLVTRVAARLAMVTVEVLLVLDSPGTAASLPIPPQSQVVLDEHPGSGPLGAIYSGLKASRTPWVLVAACDLPFLEPRLLAFLLDQRGTHEAVCPMVRGLPEPAHAAYSRDCLPSMLRRIQAGRLKLADVLQDLRVAYVAEEEMRRIDPDLISFLNVNTQADLDRALVLAKGSSR